ncbi:hypothetical protein PS726_06495 [Pseudomonas fluorescens]|nr:hypothetical protein PS726_06493 [Pseudomonas fluorescens]VVO44935.1 hypothetical protein PS726_06495 [Pseudomonas fluorescens]
MNWHRPILSRGRAFADRYRVSDSTVIFLLLRVMARTPASTLRAADRAEGFSPGVESVRALNPGNKR